ncbi:4'-phosphopantetheinyl transferase family protein [Bacillus mycoides]|uniref:4'-phosphopantetheinyl transferase n=2 Tax=Bacillus cereus group TaxID=86661 RepID=A0A243ARQ1_BACTU|nr:4'-phosphopantetheinyl transferase [Bacillus thuringiensis serovar navarrensis]QBP90327.1 4'-phosphopantetheinyl transferase superfamily protein [Bacillus mycoides]QWG87511.1 4'-phosphopantetheinyl transferase superfamily protein [Bacillus mycoides]QWH09677.1 4'-phosphopantetheinyl transferase superfamily protein [Bacillus mycoides]QWH54063.1 4'-phosphopantetheinyl transferase superfamily protein [Bacillus mycoides]
MKIPKNIGNHLFNQFSNLISNEKRERMKRLLNLCDINRTLIGDLLIRSLVCQKYKISNEEIRFIYNEYGKPFVENFSDFHFNISHSGEWVVCGTANSNVGIDIEKVSEIEALKLANEFFSDEEFYDISSMNSDEQINYFYDIWTLKESYIKTIGKGLYIPLNSFSIKKESRTLISYKNIPKDFYFRQYSIEPNYKISACATREEFPQDIIIKDIYTICQNINKF